VPRLLHFFHTQDQGAYTVSSLVDNFSINPSRLTNTVFALTTTGQIIGAVTETIVPLISRFASSKVSNGSSETSFTKTDKPEEAKFLDRIRKESALPQYELFGDYAELVQQVCSSHAMPA
jgi:anoctamin-10